MSIDALIERFDRFTGGAHFGDWRVLRQDIVSEHDQAADEAARVLCLKMHIILMDAVERTIAPSDLATFQKTRSQDYNRMLIQEAMIGRTDGNIDPAIMASITRREVRDGRIAPDDELHKLAVAGAEVIGSNPPKPPSGLAAKLRSWFS